ncbi:MULTISPECIES: hypothetical protein [Aeromicrobium]|uniref:hypothetical protein n=1 Tax=Aeromicrobium TaxID=2040 RepID=UPI00257B0A0B|nr:MULTISPECIES: hypothetical protein [Aeromicrobium]
MWWHTAGPGDWVRADKHIHASLGDYLVGAGISPGTRGVVVERRGGRALVEFGHGIGATRATVPVNNLSVVRRGGGIDSFHTRSRRMAVVRLALAAFLLFPLAQFVILHLWEHHTFAGIVPAFAEAAVWSVGDWLGMLLGNPVQTLVYCGFLWVLAKIAFRR